MYWTSPGGKTPASTLYSALLRELKTKKDPARDRSLRAVEFIKQQAKAGS
jgi:hypothetical protein